MAHIIGTEGNDSLTGTTSPSGPPYQNDVIEGLGGDDFLLENSGGDDVLRGGAGNDTLIVRRGANSDGAGRFTDGSATLDGGAGDDVLRVNAPYSPTLSPSMTVIGGDGADVAELSLWGNSLTIDMGGGDDTVFLTGSVTTQVRLGAGRDTIYLDDYGSPIHLSRLRPRGRDGRSDIVRGTSGNTTDRVE